MSQAQVTPTTDIEEIVKKQREFFGTKATLDVKFRKQALIRFRDAFNANKAEIFAALKTDLNKSEFESYETEFGMVNCELDYMIKSINHLAKPKMHNTPFLHFPALSYTYTDPYGVVLVMSPWNYPILLTLTPVIGAIAAGNCVVVKPSNYSPATTAIIKKLLSIFPDEYITVSQGGRDVNNALLDQKFDYIFFTGSPNIGKLVMEKAAKNLTPVTLELGGKSPCIVDNTAKIDLASRRIIWGKCLNSSQTCIAPDYILVHESVKDDLIKGLKKYIKKFYGEHPEKNDDYPKMINENHFNRICKLIDDSGYNSADYKNAETLQIAPCIMDNCTWDSLVMEDELFGPIIPILTFKSLDEAITKVNSRPKPLALYFFSKSVKNQKKVLKEAFFGGGCINETVVHIATHYIPFGGVGNSGMGKYHGKASYELFSHTKGITKKSNIIDIAVKYPPFNSYGKGVKYRIMKFFL